MTARRRLGLRRSRAAAVDPLLRVDADEAELEAEQPRHVVGEDESRAGLEGIYCGVDLFR